MDIHTLSDSELNEVIARAKGWAYHPNGYWKWVLYCGYKEEGDYQYDCPDFTHDSGLAMALLEEILDNEQFVSIEHNTWHSGYSISQTDKDKFCPTLERAVAEYFAEWKGL